MTPTHPPHDALHSHPLARRICAGKLNRVGGRVSYLVWSTKEDFTFESLGGNSERSKFVQKVSSGVREQRAVKQRVLPSDRVWSPS